MQIVKATAEHISEVSRLFDLYRQFYECDPDIATATHFISERISRNESDILLAMDDQKTFGFVQLYPSFCSVSAIKIYILYDLYVESSNRNSGVGTSLLHAAHNWARSNNAGRVDLLTAHRNTAAQRLYEKLTYQKVLEDFYSYSLEL